jgi:glutamate--cysteine ligase
MSLTRQDPELERTIEDRGQLVDFFRAGEKPPARWRVGTEHEKVGLYDGRLQPVPYEGPHGIGALLGKLRVEHGFEPLIDDETLVGLEKHGATITLEPGGQLELSGAPFRTMHQTCKEFRDHLALMKHVSAEFGIVWLGLGMHPLASVDELPRMPRERHDIMRAVLAKRGALALNMMHATGSVQANFDFASERDMATKLRLATAASPIVTALYANSSISEGKANGFESMRAWIWRHTDSDRCGLLPFVFEESFLEEEAYWSYAEWALDVPMFFIQRGGRHLPLGGLRFRKYLERGHADTRATLADWALHLTTLFPEVRLKQILEIRGADAVPPDLVCALSALWKGLLYDEESRQRALGRIRGWTFEEVDRMHANVARRGLSAEAPDAPVLELARELVELSAEGLRRIGLRNSRSSRSPIGEPRRDASSWPAGRGPGSAGSSAWSNMRSTDRVPREGGDSPVGARARLTPREGVR